MVAKNWTNDSIKLDISIVDNIEYDWYTKTTSDSTWTKEKTNIKDTP